MAVRARPQDGWQEEALCCWRAGVICILWLNPCKKEQESLSVGRGGALHAIVRGKVCGKALIDTFYDSLLGLCWVRWAWPLVRSLTGLPAAVRLGQGAVARREQGWQWGAYCIKGAPSERPWAWQHQCIQPPLGWCQGSQWQPRVLPAWAVTERLHWVVAATCT